MSAVRTACACLLAMAMPLAPLGASVTPRSSTGDPRIQTVEFDAEEVVLLRARGGFQMTIEFAPGERIENVAVGDAGSWQATPNRGGDRLFLKASQSAGNSNMVVITDARTYAFELTQSDEQDAPYLVRFTYPALAKAPVATAPSIPVSRYTLSGARALRPQLLWDDGVHTYLAFAEGMPMPAVFAVDASGQELLVNGAMRDGRYVVDAVAPRLRFRIGKQLASATRQSPRPPR